MFFKRMALIAILGILVMASCGRRMARFDMDFDFGEEFEQSLVEDLDLDDEVTVIRREGREVIFNETVAFNEIDDLDWDDFDIEPSDFSFNLSEDGLTFSMSGTDNGEPVKVTGAFDDNGSTIEVIQTEGEGR